MIARPTTDRVSVAITRTPAGYAAEVATPGAQDGIRTLADGNEDSAGLTEALVLERNESGIIKRHGKAAALAFLLPAYA